ncbi:MAG: hypothetical protein ACLP01_19110 [Solirubrobacteraceae bacterium]
MAYARTIAAEGALTAAVAVLTPAVAAAGASHTSLWQTKTNVLCGIEAPAISRTEVLCQATGVPRPPHSSRNEGDPGVVLADHGSPQLILMSQDLYPSGATSVTLPAGTVWSARGVTCTIAVKTVTCKNRSGHGFTIGNGKYKHF